MGSPPGRPGVPGLLGHDDLGQGCLGADDAGGLPALVGLHRVIDHLRPILESAEALALNDGEVGKDVLPFWADDELRSLNGQMEFILRKALRDAGRLSVKSAKSEPTTPPEEPDSGPTYAKD